MDWVRIGQIGSTTVDCEGELGGVVTAGGKGKKGEEPLERSEETPWFLQDLSTEAPLIDC